MSKFTFLVDYFSIIVLVHLYLNETLLRFGLVFCKVLILLRCMVCALSLPLIFKECFYL